MSNHINDDTWQKFTSRQSNAKHSNSMGEAQTDKGGLDPKQQCGEAKMGFNSVSHSLLVLVEAAMQTGADKYGAMNWLQLPDNSLKLSTYLNAAQRHWMLFKAGQDRTSDTDIHNLDAIMAGLCVVRDAMLHGKVRDDRVKLTKEQLVVFEKLINKEEMP